jgi:hypothetical protein
MWKELFIGTNDFVEGASDSLNSVGLSHMMMVLNDDGSYAWSYAMRDMDELDRLRELINKSLDKLADEIREGE